MYIYLDLSYLDMLDLIICLLLPNDIEQLETIVYINTRNKGGFNKHYRTQGRFSDLWVLSVYMNILLF